MKHYTKEQKIDVARMFIHRNLENGERMFSTDAIAATFDIDRKTVYYLTYWGRKLLTRDEIRTLEGRFTRVYPQARKSRKTMFTGKEVTTLVFITFAICFVVGTMVVNAILNLQ